MRLVSVGVGLLLGFAVTASIAKTEYRHLKKHKKKKKSIVHERVAVKPPTGFDASANIILRATAKAPTTFSFAIDEDSFHVNKEGSISLTFLFESCLRTRKGLQPNKITVKSVPATGGTVGGDIFARALKRRTEKAASGQSRQKKKAANKQSKKKKSNSKTNNADKLSKFKMKANPKKKGGNKMPKRKKVKVTPNFIILTELKTGAYELTVPSKKRFQPCDFTIWAFLSGDVNADKAVDADDLGLIESLLGASQEDPEYVWYADIDHNGKIDSQDVDYVKRNLGTAFKDKGTTPTPAPTPTPTTGNEDVLAKDVIQIGTTALELEVRRAAPEALSVGIGDAGTLLLNTMHHSIQFVASKKSHPLLDPPPSFRIPVPDTLENLSAENALSLARFVAQQLSKVTIVQEDDRRRLEGACATFPDYPCSYGCCDMYQKCLAENGCDDTKSWRRLICEDVLTCSAPKPAILDLGLLGQVYCPESLNYVSGNCCQCANVAIACYTSGCNGPSSETNALCFDSKCGNHVQCSTCNGSSDSSCCDDCIESASGCSPASTCGNGICDYGEDISNCFTDCIFNDCPESTYYRCGGVCVDPNSDPNNCGACGIHCPDGLDCVLGHCTAQLSITWTHSTEGTSTGGWSITNEGKTIRYNVEDSANCGGSNTEIQSGSAIATITTPDSYTLKTEIVGNAELEDTGFEDMSVSIDGKLIISATSDGQGLECAMGPPLVEWPEGQESVFLDAGEHSFQIDFTTGDGLYHKDAYYELDLIFTPEALSCDTGNTCSIDPSWQTRLFERDGVITDRQLAWLTKDCKGVSAPSNWVGLKYPYLSFYIEVDATEMDPFYCNWYLNGYNWPLWFDAGVAKGVSCFRDYLSSEQKDTILATVGEDRDVDAAIVAGTEIAKLFQGNKKMICRHHAMALLSVLDSMNISATLECKFSWVSAAHCWVEATIDGKRYILDAYNAVYVYVS